MGDGKSEEHVQTKKIARVCWGGWGVGGGEGVKDSFFSWKSWGDPWGSDRLGKLPIAALA